MSEIKSVFAESSVRTPVDLRRPKRTASNQALHRSIAPLAQSPAGKAGAAPAQRAKAIVQAFNTWAFKREQPDRLDLAEAAAARAAAEGRPLPFVLYWGKGPRHDIAAPDLACLDYLAALAQRVRGVHAEGAAIHIVFTDTHAGLNGHPAQVQERYFGAVAAAAEARGFHTARLGAVVAAAPAEAGAGVEEPEAAVRASLEACAAKWFRGEGSVEAGALEYYRMNMVEKRAIAAAYPDAVFVTFNGSDFRDLFPDGMPIFYMYSLRRGFGVKPWFLAAEPGADVSAEAVAEPGADVVSEAPAAPLALAS